VKLDKLGLDDVGSIFIDDVDSIFIDDVDSVVSLIT
jgi:hypothetical protein